MNYHTPLGQWPDATLRRFCDAHATELRRARARVFDPDDTVAQEAERTVARISRTLGPYWIERAARMTLRTDWRNAE
jgi:hypothetical protein